MNFLQHFLGEHDGSFHTAGLVFALFGNIIYKYHAWKLHQRECKIAGHNHTFNFKRWLKENTLDLIVSLIVSFIAVRFIDVVLHWVNPKLDGLIGITLPVTEDQIAYYFIVAILVQWVIHKYYRKNK